MLNRAVGDNPACRPRCGAPDFRWPWAALLIGCLGAVSLRAAAPYAEPYRPQYHFSPRKGWIGDPDGTIRYRGLYHLFWWGHAVSDDLVFWREQPRPMRGGDGSFEYFSGSVVVDHANTTGLGTAEFPPLVALYTAHRRSDGFDDQRISASSDGGTYFDYYPGNPILSLEGMPCRDPDVFWHEPAKRWVMAVVAPERRKILFFGSPDLKSWSYLSEFGPVGARSQNWEVPNLIQIPFENDPASKKWVLFCGMGPNKIQYFPGDFDGTQFVMDAATRAFLEEGAGLDGEVFVDFEKDDALSRWQAEGTAFAGAHSGGSPRFSGYLGRKFLRSNAGVGEAQGRLVSPPFTISRNAINFLLAGSSPSRAAAVNLLIDGRIAASAFGDGTTSLKWHGWNVAAWKGRQAQIEVVDAGTKPGDFIALDHVTFSDMLMNTGREQANWVDWGTDFYAARAWRDEDGTDPAVRWIGWMGNWDYANDVPTSWGKGAQSLPRELMLVPSAAGWCLRQTPLPALKKLRGAGFELTPQPLKGIQAVTGFRPSQNSYEIEAVFGGGDGGESFGLNLCVAGEEKVVVGYDSETGQVFLDRRLSGDVSFSPNFPSLSTASVPRKGGEITFHIFVDQSSIEVFVNNGEAVLTALIFPKPSSLGIELFSQRGAVEMRRFQAWPLRSIWGAGGEKTPAAN